MSPAAGRGARVGLVAGGTGGHVYPAIAVAAALVASAPGTEVTFLVDARPGSADAVRRSGHEPVVLPMTRGLQRGRSLAEVRASMAAAGALVRSFLVARRWLRAHRPDVVVGFGAYVTVPVIVAARLAGVPIVVHEQNGHAGLANRLAVRLGARAAISVPDTRLGADPVLTGNPVRPEIVGVVRAPETPPLVAVVGATHGAAVLNDATLGLRARWRARDDVALHLVTGPEKLDAVVARLDADRRPTDRISCSVVGYEHDMPGLYRRATVMVTRGGGSVMELAAAGMPAVIVPWTGAAEDHQSANARAAAAAGGAIHLPERECDAERLATVLDDLLADPEHLARMHAAMLAFARPDAAGTLASLTLSVAGRAA